MGLPDFMVAGPVAPGEFGDLTLISKLQRKTGDAIFAKLLE